MSLEFIRIDIACPTCRKASLELLKEALSNDGYVCPSCGHHIDLSTRDWREFLAEAERFYRKLFHLS